MPQRLPLILLPPSEGKTAGGRGPSWRPGTMSIDLDDRRSQVISALARAMEQPAPARSKLLGVKGPALEAATSANRSIAVAPTMRAIDRYTGVLYGALDASSLSPSQRRRLGSSVLVFSGLWGVVAPGDALPDYKVKMAASLPGVGKLSTWWREPVTEALRPHAAGRVVWNLLPNEHDHAWRADEVPCRRRYTVRFLERGAEGELVAVSHWNKFLKGALVRFLLDEPGAGPEQLARWTHPSGHRLDPDVTEDLDGTIRLTFVRRERGPVPTGSPGAAD